MMLSLDLSKIKIDATLGKIINDMSKIILEKLIIFVNLYQFAIILMRKVFTDIFLKNTLWKRISKNTRNSMITIPGISTHDHEITCIQTERKWLEIFGPISHEKYARTSECETEYWRLLIFFTIV